MRVGMLMLVRGVGMRDDVVVVMMRIGRVVRTSGSSRCGGTRGARCRRRGLHLLLRLRRCRVRRVRRDSCKLRQRVPRRRVLRPSSCGGGGRGSSGLVLGQRCGRGGRGCDGCSLLWRSFAAFGGRDGRACVARQLVRLRTGGRWGDRALLDGAGMRFHHGGTVLRG